MENQGRKPQQEEDSNLIMFYCLVAMGLVLLSYCIVTTFLN